MPPHASRYLPSSGSEPPIPDAAAAPRHAPVVVELLSGVARGSRPTGEAAGPR
eukprot:CAMPEP_0202742272 /NCGR_PEP_ID=MMETSP1388-20130828/4916_1 /ASSEMBLY_ACC=CAM_ASM_000864 /TAXON_ID=37098 /ORGANISM="Isochrysis sp, Strain CCMP1244" /LENGTH=52 /DNA_ID=CAMNT_0049409187 /DNA_START=320 /DNA_END=475 /DNA_ORIENTATION=-